MNAWFEALANCWLGMGFALLIGHALGWPLPDFLNFFGDDDEGS